jgi:hypothetical protein
MQKLDGEEVVDIVESTINQFYDNRKYQLYLAISIMAEERKSYFQVKEELYNSSKLRNRTIKSDELKKRIEEDKKLLKLGIKNKS